MEPPAPVRLCANMTDRMADWTAAMREGRFEAAWALSAEALAERDPATRDDPRLPYHRRWVWDGTDPRGRHVLVRCYHGLGDTIQFVRYMPQLRAVAADVIVWAQPKLLPLLRGVEGIDTLLPLHDGTPDVEYDVDVEIMELAHVFRSTPTTLPRAVPYLHAAPMPLPERLPRPRVGVVWQGGDWDRERSMSFEAIRPLLDAAPGTVLILQPGAHAAGWDGRSGTFPGELDIPDYARALKALDLLITIDSMPAHLAGALGVPVWTLLHHDPDWRWMEGRDDSPWYPQMRLFRQRAAGDWAGVIDAASTRLASL